MGTDAPKITVDYLCANPRPLPPVIQAAFRAAQRADLERQEAEGRLHLKHVQLGFLTLAGGRRRLDPRRIGDRYVARRCARLVAFSVAAGEARKPNA